MKPDSIKVRPRIMVGLSVSTDIISPACSLDCAMSTDYLHQAGHVFSSVCWFARLLAGLQKNDWPDVPET